MTSTRRRRPAVARPGSVRSAARGAAFLLALAAAACAPGSDDPILSLPKTTLKRGDRLVLLRSLDPEGTRVGMVVATASGKPELRIYEQKKPRQYALVHSAQQGDVFGDLGLEDVDGDGQDEIVATWEGGHLEMVQVIARGADGVYRTIFQNAGREIERRYDPAGRIEFWITSRTYEEGPGQPPAYATTVYHLEDGKYVEARRK
jgi:hypothetical protein